MELESSVRERIANLLSEKPQRNPYKRFTILSYQLADAGRCLRYMEIYPDEHEAYAEYFKTALADLVIQCAILAELYKLDFAELIRLGSERLDEFKRRGHYVEVE
jgi:hypothetical protein